MSTAVATPEQCPYDPTPLMGEPIGMFHCPLCGDMVIAGLPHPPPWTEVMDEEYRKYLEEHEPPC